MGTNVYMGRTTVSELRERIRKLGGTPKGKTKAQLLDELESLIVGDGQTITQDDIEQAVAIALDNQLRDAIAEVIEPGTLTDGDFDDIFGESGGE